MTPRPDYVSRVNRAIDHILEHLDESLKLDEVARVAGFSSYHFHRVFKLTMGGETLQQFVKRVRLERALHLLAHGPRLSLTELALRSGFGSSADFSRSFKQRFGVPPSAFEIDTFRAAQREEMQRLLLPEGERHRLQRLSAGENPDGFAVQLRELPSRTVAYLRVRQPYEGDGVARAAEQLWAWALERGWEAGQWLGYQWDDPEIVPLDKCRYDVGVSVPEAFHAEGEVGRLALPPMQVAELALDGSIDLEMRALDWLYRSWLPESGFVPDHQPCFEAWEGRPFADGPERFRLKVQLPVVLG